MIIEVPHDERRAVRQAYKSSKHQMYIPLTGAVTPQQEVWNRAATLVHKYG